MNKLGAIDRGIGKRFSDMKGLSRVNNGGDNRSVLSRIETIRKL